MPNSPYPLTRASQTAIDRAGRIAEQHKQPSLDSLTLLLALLQLPNSQVSAVLTPLHVKVENLAARIVATLKLDAKQSTLDASAKRAGVNFTAEAEDVLNASSVEMDHQGLKDIDELTLLLGMLQSPASKAGQILSQYDVTAEQVRERVKIQRERPAPKKPIFALPKTLARGMRHGISPVFIGLVLFTVAMAAFLWLGIGNSPQAFLIGFVMGGWIISVALHEFGHAIVAFWGGDESVEDKGYLTLNPLKYSNPLLSIVIPVFMLLLGGIGFPGGAVYINIYALRKPVYRSLVSAAGPLANLILVILLALPFDTLPFFYFFWSLPTEFLIGIAFLAFLQITSIIVNLLPIPGLDGFGILEPFLPHEIVQATNFIRPFGFFILYFLVFIDSPISNFFWSNVWLIAEFFSPNLAYYANEGILMLLSWR
ncbi:MAG: site-2 protease family protein [Anaerolineales bacterium]|nr:site-2 protease family protein [Anaerolineales bacterium]